MKQQVLKVPQNSVTISRYGDYPKQLVFGAPDNPSGVHEVVARKGLGGYETATCATLLSICQCNASDLKFFDVGAHAGFYTALIETVFGNLKRAKFLAFEASPDTARLCRQTRDLNQLDYEVINLAVSSEVGQVEFYLSPTWATSSSMNPNFRSGSKSIQVESTTLDAFCVKRRIAPTVLKIDVETLEGEVLIGSKQMISRKRPWIVCEILREVLATAEEAPLGEALCMLEDNGYAFYPIGKDNEWSSHSIQQVLSMTKNVDWLIAANPLGDEFADIWQSWHQALIECDASTNVLREWQEPKPKNKSTPTILEQIMKCLRNFRIR